MLNQIRPAATMLVAMTLLTGLAYPLAMTGLARVIAPELSQASITLRDGQPIGSALVVQPFAGAGYLHPRPSAVDYATMPSGASNLSPGSTELARQIAERRAAYQATNGAPAPVDAVTASGSGLDPEISVANATAQAIRIAKARGVDPDAVQAVIAGHVTQPLWGLYGEARVNVLLTNLALDEAMPMTPSGGN